MLGYVLLTAAVTPDPRFGSAVFDPQVRLAQYQRALASWVAAATEKGWMVLVVETTGCAVSEIVAGVSVEARKSIEVVHFSPDDSLAQRGKGAIEASAIDHLISTTKIVDSATVYKATGRLILENSSKLLIDIAEEAATVRRTMDGKYCDSRFFGTTAGFWRQRLIGMANEVDDMRGRFLEHVLAHRLRDAEYTHASTIGRFTQRPVLVGVSGTTGSSYRRLDGVVRNRLWSPLEDILVNRFMNKQV